MHDDNYQLHPHLSNLALTNSASASASSDHKDTKEANPAAQPASSPPSPRSMSMEGEEDEEELKYTVFLNWLRTNGARFPHLTLRRYAKDYRGVHIASPPASQPLSPITKGKTLLRIPHRLLITVELARSTPLGALISQLPNIGSQAILACYLIQERRKGADSVWHHWLNVLPERFDTLPMFFGENDLAELEGCNELLVKVRSQQRSMREEYQSIVRLPGVSAIAQFSYDEFVWAALAVGTRVFSLCINNQKTSVLAPLADMMNHKNPAGSSWSYCNRRGAFTLTACCTMQAGEAVYESYGVKDNKRFFASYGFCLDDNPANEASVTIKGELMVDERQSRSFVVRACYDSAMEELMSFLRMCNAYEYQMDEAGGMARSTTPSTPSSTTSASSAFSAYTRSSFTVPLSIDNELSALYALRCACKEHLSLYPTKLEYDQQLLARLEADGDDGGNMRNILVFRMGEKRIYRWLIEFSTVAIGLLCQPWDEARLRIKDMMERGSGGGGGHMGESAGMDELSGMMAYVSGVVAPLLQERSKLRRGGGVVSGGLSERVSRRLNHDVDRRAVLGVSASSGGDSVMDYSRDMHSDESDDEEEDDDNAVETGSNSEKDSTPAPAGGMTAGQYLHHFSTATTDDTLSATMRSILAEVSSSLSASSANPSASSSKRSSLTSLPSLPPVPAVRSQGSSVRSSFVNNLSFSPQLSPSSSASPYNARHIPRSAASARSAAPRLLPAMPPVSRASSHSSTLASNSSSTPVTSTSSSVNRSSASQLPGTIAALPSSSHSRLPSMQSASTSSTSSTTPTSAATAASSRSTPATTTSSSAFLSKGRRSSGNKVSPARVNPPPVLHSAPSPTPSTSDDSNDDGTPPVDECDESDEGEAGGSERGKSKAGAAMSGGKERERRRSGGMKYCASS